MAIEWKWKTLGANIYENIFNRLWKIRSYDVTNKKNGLKGL